jgi:RimJ/RimL family protein N-acetyltransferase
MPSTMLHTTRLLLREFSADDVEDLLRSDGDAQVMRYLANGLAPRTRDEVRASLGRMQAAYLEIGMQLSGMAEHYGRPMQVYVAEHH